MSDTTKRLACQCLEGDAEPKLFVAIFFFGLGFVMLAANRIGDKFILSISPSTFSTHLVFHLQEGCFGSKFVDKVMVSDLKKPLFCHQSLGCFFHMFGIGDARH